MHCSAEVIEVRIVQWLAVAVPVSVPVSVPEAESDEGNDCVALNGKRTSYEGIEPY